MKKCKQGYYYCYTDEKCKPISKGLKVTARFSGGGREPEETGIDVPTNGNNQNGNGNGNGNSNGGSNGGGVSEGTLHKWFKGSKSKDGKGGWVNVVTGGTCASDEPGEGTPKCVSSAKRASMSKAARLSAQRRKKEADPRQQQKTGAAKPTYVATDKKKMKKEEVEIIEGSSIRQGQTSNKKVSYRGATSDVKRDKDGNIPASHYKKEKPNIVSIKRKDTRTDEQKKKHSDAVRKYDNYKKLQAKIFAKDDARKMKKEEKVFNEFVGTALAGTKGAIDAKPKDRVRKAIGSGAGYAVGSTAGKEVGKSVGGAVGQAAGVAAGKSATLGIGIPGAGIVGKEVGKAVGSVAGGVAGGVAGSTVGNKLAGETKKKKEETNEEMQLSEYSTLVRQGIKVAGKRGGRAVQGGLKSGKTATKNAIQKKEAGRGEKVGKVIGGVVGGIAGGAAGAGVASIGTGIAGGQVGERIGGAIGKKFDKKKKEEVTEAKDKKGKGSGTKDACYHKVKSRYSVWPSAYASGALVKCRKVGAANWGNSTKKESYELSNWRDDFKATEYEFVDLIKPEPIKGGQEQIDEGQKCWKGYEKKGTKKMFGKTYNNCVKKEEKQIGGGNLKKLAGKATKRIDADTDGDVDTKDMKSSETGEFVPSPCGNKKLKPKVRFEQSDWRSDLGEDWQKVNKSDKTDGMSQKAVNAYRRENPGSKLKTAVTGNPKKGSKDAKRRSSYCSRSEGQKDMHNIDCTKTPDKAICKARRRWKC